ncbi:MAG TPA: hypothetical protein VI819_02305, partial [Patescibacteria group bacterium]|nr:hypothetical protein [Patescibacteria group bacterium]
ADAILLNASDAAGGIDINFGTGDLDIDGTGAGSDFTLDAGGIFSIDGVGASNVTATSGNLTLSTATTGNVIINAAQALDIDAAGAITINNSGSGNDITISSIDDLVLDSANDTSSVLFSDYVDCEYLYTGTSGVLSCGTAVPATTADIYWTQNDATGVLYPKNATVDLLVGSDATATAKFRVDATTGVINVGGGGTAAYNYFSNGAFSNVDIAEGAGDLFIEDELEVNGATRFDGSVDTQLSGTEYVNISNTDFTNTGLLMLTATNTVTNNDDQSAINISYSNIDDLNAEALYGIKIMMDNKEASAADSVYGMMIRNDNTSTADLDAGLYINNADAAQAITDGILIAGTSTGLITDAIDVSDAEIGNALNMGANFAKFDNIRMFEGTTDILTFENTAGNDLLNLTVESNYGNATASGSLASNTGIIGINSDASANNVLSYGASSAVVAGDATGNLYWGQDILCDADQTNCGWATAGEFTNYWQLDGTNQTLSPYNETLDVLIGDTATATAEFAFRNLAGGTPTFTLGGGAAAVIDTVSNDNLTIAPQGTGDLILDPTGVADILIGSADITSIILDSDAFSIDADAGASNITLTSDGANDDLTIALAGNTDSSLFLSSTGTAADALTISTTQGGIDITAAGNLAGEDLDITTTGTTTELRLTSASTELDAIALSSAGGITLDAVTALSIDVTNAGGASNISVAADADAEDLTIETTGSAGDLILNSADTLTLNVANATSIIFSDYITDANAVLYTDTNGVVTRVVEDETGDLCLLSGSGASGVPSWQACPGGTNYWQLGTDAKELAPYNLTLDTMFGGIASASAQLRIAGIETAAGNILDITSDTITSGTVLDLTNTTLVDGKLLNVQSTSTALTTGNLGLFDWSPSVWATASGDLFKINLGQYGDTTGNLFAIYDNSTELFSVDSAKITSNLPHEFTGQGDVSFSYDANFVNQGISQIESNAPFSIVVGESNENNDLTLKTYGTGDVIVNPTGTGELVVSAADPTLILDTTTTTDTDYWAGVVEDAGGDDDDTFQIGDGTTPGSNTFLTINTNGETTLNGVSGATTGLTITDTDYTNAMSIADNNITGTTYSLVGTTGNINFMPSNDVDDYLYMNTAADVPGLFWEGIAGTDPGIYVTGTELGYRDETDAWVSFDSLATGATNYWQINEGALSPFSLTADILLGGIASSSAKIDLSGSLTRGRAVAIFNQTESQDILSASASGSTRMSLDNDGDLFLYHTDGTSYLSLGHDGTNANITTNVGDINIGTGGGDLTLGVNGGASVGLLFDETDQIYATAGETISISDVLTILPDVADTNTYDIGSTTGEWDALFLGSGEGAYFGAGQEFMVAYDQATDTAFEITDGTNLFLGINDNGSNGDILLSDNAYLNWGGATYGTTGYGVRDNNGRMEFKHESESWTEFGSGVASNYWQLGTNGLAPYILPLDTYFGGIATASAQLRIAGIETTDGNILDINSDTITTGSIIDIDNTTLTTGWGFDLQSTSTALTGVGGLAKFDWSPSAWATSSADLVKINLGQFGDMTGNLFAIYDNSTELFSVDTAKITSAIPHEFTATGNVSVAYDMTFTNQTAATIDSYGPLTIRAGESFENNNLTLKTWGTGDIIIDNDGSSTGIITDTGDVVLGATDATNIGGSGLLAYGAVCADDTVDSADDCIDAARTAGTVYGITSQFDIDDIAENFPTMDESIDTGDIVSLDYQAIPDGAGDNYEGEFVKKAVNGDRNQILGAISQRAGVLLGGFNQDNDPRSVKEAKVALAGRIPVKVNSQNGNINPGDPITISSVAGVGAKATSAGYLVGVALGKYENTDPSETGTVMVFINRTWFDPAIAFDQNGYVRFAADELNPGYQNLTDTNGNLVNKLSVIDLLVSDFKVAVAQVTETLTAREINSQNIDTQDLNSQSISTSDIEVTDLLTAQNIQITNATISGELTVGTIHANEIIANSATFTDTDTAKLFGMTREDIESLLQEAEINNNLIQQTQSWIANTATGSASFADIAVEDLFVTGTGAFDSLSVTNAVTFGNDLVISPTTYNLEPITSIDTLTAPLSIQSSASQPLYLMAGLVKINTNGDVEIAGNLFVAGNVESKGLKLKADGLQTTEGENLLSITSDNGTEIAGINASGSARLTGIEAGSAQFTDVLTGTIAIESDPTATTSAQLSGLTLTTEAVAGSATITSGYSDITIVNSKVKPDSLIFVTPKTNTQNQNLYLKSQDDGHVVIGFDAPADMDVEFNWWLVDLN